MFVWDMVYIMQVCAFQGSCGEAIFLISQGTAEVCRNIGYIPPKLVLNPNLVNSRLVYFSCPIVLKSYKEHGSITTVPCENIKMIEQIMEGI